MPKVNLITAPDQLYNQNISMLLIDPKDLIKNDFNELLKTLTKDINLYLWETKDDANDYKWLIQVANSVDKIIIDLDYASLDRWLIGYFLSFGKCYYIFNQVDSSKYEMINNNKIFDLKSMQSELEIKK
jgi:hypothetical protein